MSGQWSVIHLVLFGGTTKSFLSKLARDKGVWTFFYNGSRLAVGDHSRARARVGSLVENEEITILVDPDRFDEIVTFCYEELELGEPRRGILYVIPAERAVPLVVPDEGK